MALKAGRVGVNPSQVDMAGNVIGGGGGDTYTKLEIDQMLGSKVGIGQLEANNKDFYFAYDETSQKYGYKLDGTGDFHPFEEGGSGGIGWVKPPDLTSEGITGTRCTILNGGYYDDGEFIYIDILVQRSSTSTASLAGFPAGTGNVYLLAAKDIESSDYTKYVANANFSTNSSETATGISIGGGSADGVYHIWGQYLKKVA